MRRVGKSAGSPAAGGPCRRHQRQGLDGILIRAIAEAAGLRVHAYTSPHLVRFNERIRLAGSLIRDTTISTTCWIALRRPWPRPGARPPCSSTTAAAFLAMVETPADLAIIEVGLGGSLDATNVIDRPLLSVITPVDLDHAEFLGDRGSRASPPRRRAS